mgnify:CR=1 FL=1
MSGTRGSEGRCRERWRGSLKSTLRRVRLQRIVFKGVRLVRRSVTGNGSTRIGYAPLSSLCYVAWSFIFLSHRVWLSRKSRLEFKVIVSISVNLLT